MKRSDGICFIILLFFSLAMTVLAGYEHRRADILSYRLDALIENDLKWMQKINDDISTIQDSINPPPRHVWSTNYIVNGSAYIDDKSPLLYTPLNTANE